MGEFSLDIYNNESTSALKAKKLENYVHQPTFEVCVNAIRLLSKGFNMILSADAYVYNG